MGFAQMEIDWDKWATGTISFGSLNITWDFTELVEERKRAEKMQKAMNLTQLRSGRLIMPSLGIY